jgi:hypothetical protein
MTNRLAATAGRLDRFIADVKVRQFEETGAPPILPLPCRPEPGSNPDQDWMRNYASRTIRPHRRCDPALPLPDNYAVPPPSERPLLPDGLSDRSPPAY